MSNGLLYFLRPIHSWNGDKGRRRQHQNFTTHRWRRGCFGVELAFETIPLDRPSAAGAHLLEVRALVNDHGVRVGNVGDVGRLDYDRDIALDRNHRALNALRPEFIVRNKRVLVGTDIIMIVRPIPDAAFAIKARFRRQRSPTDVILARSPRDPGRRPFFTGHPNPANPAQADPSPVMISRPSKWLFGDPGPTGVRVDPSTVGIGPPVALLSLARLPDVSVIRGFAPVAVRFQFPIKSAVGSRRARFGSIASSSNSLRRLGRRFDHRFGRCLSRDISRGGGGSLFIRQRLFAGRQLCLLLRETLFLVRLSLDRETLLHLAFYFRLFFFLGLLLLAGNKKRESRDERQNAKLFHCEVRPGWFFVIRRKLRRGPLRGRGINQGAGDAAAGAAVETGVIVTCSILSRRAFWTLA